MEDPLKSRVSSLRAVLAGEGFGLHAISEPGGPELSRRLREKIKAARSGQR
jgi:hypothetical protein